MNMRYLLPLALLIAAPACGEDEAPPPPKAGAPGAAKPGATNKKPPPAIAPRVRVEDRVLDPDEKKGIRHAFKERDFIPDVSNRDPFQSYVLNQGLGPTTEVKIDITKKCLREEQMVATNYSYTDLRLVGIVAQGTQRKVLMMDSGNFGHIIKRGDCVGREKAYVKDIGTGYITFQIGTDETSTTGVTKPAEERSVQLYPNQLTITSQPSPDNEAAKAQTPDVAPPTTVPRNAPPAPEKSQTPPSAPPTK